MFQPFIIGADEQWPFSLESVWSIEMVLHSIYVGDPRRHPENLGNWISFWLVTNSTLTSRPQIDNWGVNEKEFTGFGVVSNLGNDNRQRPANIVTVSGASTTVSVEARPTHCQFSGKRMLLKQNLFVSIEKPTGKLIWIALANSTQHKICRFSSEIPRDLIEFKQEPKPWIHFGAAAVTTVGLSYEIRQIRSRNSGLNFEETLINFSNNDDGLTGKDQLGDAILDIAKSQVPAYVAIACIFLLILIVGAIVICSCLWKRRNQRRERAAFEMANQTRLLPPPRGPQTIGKIGFANHDDPAFGPMYYPTGGVAAGFFNEQQQQQQVVNSYLGTSPMTHHRQQRRHQQHLGTTSPYASINVEDLTLDLASNYLVPSQVVLINDIVERLPFDDKGDHELSNDSFELLEEIGIGNFGIVWKAKLTRNVQGGWKQNTLVAVKQTRKLDDLSQRTSLECEMKLLAHLGKHRNVVQLIGAVMPKTNEIDDELSVVLEFCQGGNLKTFVYERRDRFVENDSEVMKIVDEAQGDNSSSGSWLLTRRHLVVLAEQIATGMEFIHAKRCVHRDLACRNILLTGDFLTAKITDFGLAKDIYSEGIYQVRKL